MPSQSKGFIYQSNGADVKPTFIIAKADVGALSSAKGATVFSGTGGTAQLTFKKTDKVHNLLAMFDGKAEDAGSNDKSLKLTLKKKVVFSEVKPGIASPFTFTITSVKYEAFNGSDAPLELKFVSGFEGGDVKAGDAFAEAPKKTKYIRITLSGSGNGSVQATVASLDKNQCDAVEGNLLGTGGGDGTESGGVGGSGTSDGGTSSDSSSGKTPGEIATAAAFSTYFQMPSLMQTKEAMQLTGRRSLLNDQPLLPFVQQIAEGSLRSFMSMPNGDFYAFYPDYFGGLGKTAYWVIKDIEIISGKIDLSDDTLFTHVFVVGDTTATPGQGNLGYGTVDWLDRMHTAGVVNVFNAFMADFVNGPPSDGEERGMGSDKPSLGNKADAIKFLQKYGARPHYEEVAAVRSPIYETFVAYQRFCYLWSTQFKTTFEFTFMPELYPGGLVEFPDHGLQCYVERVVHQGSYETGFTTMAELTAPAAMRDQSGVAIDPNKSWVHSGMIRAWESGPAGQPKDAYNEDDKNGTKTR